MAQKKQKEPGSKWEAKEKAYQAGKAKIDKCRGKKG